MFRPSIPRSPQSILLSLLFFGAIALVLAAVLLVAAPLMTTGETVELPAGSTPGEEN